MNEVIITEADFVDLETVLQLQKKAFLSEAELYNDYSLEPLLQTVESIRKDIEEYTFLKTTYQDKIIGSVKVRQQDNTCWIGRLVVHPSYQRRGIGKKLMLAVEEFFPAATEFFLFTGSRSARNIHLYESLGYKKYEEEEDENRPGLFIVKMKKK